MGTTQPPEALRASRAEPAAASPVRGGRGAPSTLTLRLGGAALAVALVLSGCAGTPSVDDGWGGAGRSGAHFPGPPDAVPRAEPKSRSGNMASYVVRGKRYYTKASSQGHVERGVASWYGNPFHGRKTSSGEIYNMHKMTAAHKTLPLPTYARVTNLDNGASAIVKVNDRGPFVGDRVIDLSHAAAQRLGVLAKGTGHVEIVSVDPRDNYGVPPGMILASSSAPAAPTVKARAADTRVASAKPAVSARSDHRAERRTEPALTVFDDGMGARGRRARAQPAPVIAGGVDAPTPAGNRGGPQRSRPAVEPVFAALDEPTPVRAHSRSATSSASRGQPAPAVVAATAPVSVVEPAPVRASTPAQSVVIAAADPLPPRPVVIGPAAPIPMEPAKPAAAPESPAPPVVAAPAKPVVVAAAASAKPAAAKPAVHKGGKPGAQPAVYLQVGAFGDRNNAEALRKRLRSRFAEQVQVHEPGSGALYKVHVGPVTSIARADSLRKQLKTLGLETPIVIRQ